MSATCNLFHCSDQTRISTNVQVIYFCWEEVKDGFNFTTNHTRTTRMKQEQCETNNFIADLSCDMGFVWEVFWKTIFTAIVRQDETQSLSASCSSFHPWSDKNIDKCRGNLFWVRRCVRWFQFHHQSHKNNKNGTGLVWSLLISVGI